VSFAGHPVHPTARDIIRETVDRVGIYPAHDVKSRPAFGFAQHEKAVLQTTDGDDLIEIQAGVKGLRLVREQSQCSVEGYVNWDASSMLLVSSAGGGSPAIERSQSSTNHQ
jgi:hypothetical protein